MVEEIDYQNLLEKYMRHVNWLHSETYVNDRLGPRLNGGLHLDPGIPDFTAKETATLRHIDARIDRYPTDLYESLSRFGAAFAESLNIRKG